MFLGTFFQKVLKERLEENTSERLRLRAAVEYNVGMLRFYRYATAWTTAILLLKQSTGKKNLARAVLYGMVADLLLHQLHLLPTLDNQLAVFACYRFLHLIFA